MKFFTILLLTAATIVALTLAETAQTRAQNFVTAVQKACEKTTLICLKPFLNKDFKYINATATLNKEEYVKFLKTQTKTDLSGFNFKVKQASDASGAQVKLPINAAGKLLLNLFLVADAKVDGGEAVILIDKKNI
ncbi:unnamed protein product [Caenorhabditis angaria]|uniref:Uncharacterized protein n=1 Tax=Caenorhabditis angaria TaxID=860376 RepID=A0A9P1MVM7_9PELO|nr:unnamed protein product [Caenorhabditis angaria]